MTYVAFVQKPWKAREREARTAPDSIEKAGSGVRQMWRWPAQMQDVVSVPKRRGSARRCDGARKKTWLRIQARSRPGRQSRTCSQKAGIAHAICNVRTGAIAVLVLTERGERPVRQYIVRKNDAVFIVRRSQRRMGKTE